MTETQPETKDKEEYTGSTAANNEQKTKNEENTGSLQKENEKASGFEILYGILCLLSYFYIRRR